MDLTLTILHLFYYNYSDLVIFDNALGGHSQSLPNSTIITMLGLVTGSPRVVPPPTINSQTQFKDKVKLVIEWTRLIVTVSGTEI